MPETLNLGDSDGQPPKSFFESLPHGLRSYFDKVAPAHSPSIVNLRDQAERLRITEAHAFNGGQSRFVGNELVYETGALNDIFLPLLSIGGTQEAENLSVTFTNFEPTDDAGCVVKKSWVFNLGSDPSIRFSEVEGKLSQGRLTELGPEVEANFYTIEGSDIRCLSNVLQTINELQSDNTKIGIGDHLPKTGLFPVVMAALGELATRK